MKDIGNRFVVMTSIFRPTAAVLRFAGLAGWKLVVAADRKTPDGWAAPGATFLAAAEQEAGGYRVAGALPWNHYCRKMIGYVYAIRNGATLIVDSDDDNLPKTEWGFPAFDAEYRTSADGLGFVNVYRLFTDQRIWPRGFPLERLTSGQAVLEPAALSAQPGRVGIWQGLADGDPDVDAIYRLTDNTPCYFNEAPPVVLGRGTLCPINSQNTAFRREVFPLLYLPAHVTFRFTDILRGLVAQPILWAAGWRLGFTGANVVQERNPHDPLKDFESEIPCYLHSTAVADVVRSVVSDGASISDNLHRAYRKLVGVGIVPERELEVLDAWLEDLAAVE